MDDPSEVLIRDLATRFDGLKALLAEHVEDNDEILPHVFMADVTRWVEGGAADSERAAVLDQLEQEYGGDDVGVRELITVSFLENLSEGSLTVLGLPPLLRAEYEELYG